MSSKVPETPQLGTSAKTSLNNLNSSSSSQIPPPEANQNKTSSIEITPTAVTKISTSNKPPNDNSTQLKNPPRNPVQASTAEDLQTSTCPHCDQTFRSPQGLNLHKKRCKAKVAANQPKPGPKKESKSYKCKVKHHKYFPTKIAVIHKNVLVLGHVVFCTSYLINVQITVQE